MDLLNQTLSSSLFSLSGERFSKAAYTWDGCLELFLVAVIFDAVDKLGAVQQIKICCIRMNRCNKLSKSVFQNDMAH